MRTLSKERGRNEDSRLKLIDRGQTTEDELSNKVKAHKSSYSMHVRLPVLST